MLKIKKDSQRTKQLKKRLVKELRVFNMNIDAELLKKFKIRTVMRGETMTDVLIAKIIEYVK